MIIWLPISLLIKELSPVVTELFIRGSKVNISLVFITQSYFSVVKNIRPNFRHYFIIKISSKWELQQIAFNSSSDIDLKNFMNVKDERWKLRYHLNWEATKISALL